MRLRFDFSSLKGSNFQVPYIVEDSAGSYAVKFLSLDKDEKGEIDLAKFGADYKSLMIIPSLQSKTSGFDSPEPDSLFTYTVYITGSQPVEDIALMQKLMDQITYLKTQIAKVQGRPNGNVNQSVCSNLSKNLHIGMSNSDVQCLQTFLKLQDGNIYPEGLVTGNFGPLTQKAVIRFQEKYASDILAPVGLTKGTGYVGENTREKINQILNGG